jgi:hypothetical protein
MLRRRSYLSGIYPSHADDGVYGVTQNLKLLPSDKVDSECIGVALIHNGHRIMIEKNENNNQSYIKDGQGKYSNVTFYWGGSGIDQGGIENYRNVDGVNIRGYLKPEQSEYVGTPHISYNISEWTQGCISDWNGRSNSEILKLVTTGGYGYNSYATIGFVLNTFLNSDDAKGLDDWYIPSIPQLALIYMYKNSINNIMSSIDGLILGSDLSYWSSSEFGLDIAWTIRMDSGYVDYMNKISEFRVRFVRDI